MATKELFNILKVGNDDYNINAVHSDASAKVDHTLTISQTQLHGDSVHTIYDGSTDKTVSVVSSDGGTFTGPVAVQSLSELTNITPDDKNRLAINYKDVRDMIQLLTGHPCYEWTGDELVEKKLEDTITMQKASVIAGTANNYTSFITQEPKPAFFIYLCEDTGQIFFGQEADNYSQLGTNAVKVVYTDDYNKGFTAENLESHAKSIQSHENSLNEIKDPEKGTLAQAKQYTDVLAVDKVDRNTEAIKINTNAIAVINDINNGILATANKYTDAEINEVNTKHKEDLETANNAININKANIATNTSIIAANSTNISKNTSAISDINNKTTGILATAKKYTDDEISKDRTRLTSIENSISSITNTSSGILANAQKLVNDLKDDIKDGTVIAKKSTSADTATKATKDSNDNIISTYYQKKITISSSNPSGGSNGDIWIKY